MKNTFYHGDCKFVLEHDIGIESVDLIYLDPPFYTGQVMSGEVKVTNEGIVHSNPKWNPESMEVSYNDSKRFWAGMGLHRVAPEWMKYIASVRKDGAAFASYLYYMKERLELCHKVLKKTGSIYLHCDWRASHYLKMVMDEVFGVDNLQNEIIWAYRSGGVGKKRFGRKHDILLFYSKTQDYIFNPQFVPYIMGGISEDENGLYQIIKGKRVDYDPRGAMMPDVWDIPYMSSVSKERTGYPTQKPIALLERVLNASSNEGSIVLDPFCGCGTTIIAAQKLNRFWIGIDLNRKAYDVLEERFMQLPLVSMVDPAYAEHKPVCRDLEAVKAITDPREFEFWVNDFYKAERLSPDRKSVV